MIVQLSKCVGPQSMIKVKENIAESGFCRVLQQNRNAEIPPPPPSLYLKVHTSTPKNTVFDCKVIKFSRRPSVICRLSVLLQKHYVQSNVYKRYSITMNGDNPDRNICLPQEPSKRVFPLRCFYAAACW